MSLSSRDGVYYNVSQQYLSSVGAFWTALGTLLSDSTHHRSQEGRRRHHGQHNDDSRLRLRGGNDDGEHIRGWMNIVLSAICGCGDELVTAKNRTKCIAGFAAAFLMILMTWLLIHLVVFSDIVYGVSESDMRPVAESEFSFLMCKSLTTRTPLSSHYRHDAYLFCGGSGGGAATPAQLPLAPETETHRALRHAYVSGQSYAIWGFYLVPQSDVRFTTCTYDAEYDVYVVKGRNNLDRWKKSRGLCDDCFIAKSDNPVCQVFGSRTRYLIDIADTDEYFFVFSNIYPPTWGLSKIEVEFELNRTVYDTSNATQKCTDEYECRFTYPNKQCFTIVKLLSDPAAEVSISGDLLLTVSLGPRTWSYIAFFVLAPCLIFLLTATSVSVCRDFKNQNAIRGLTRMSSDRVEYGARGRDYGSTSHRESIVASRSLE